MAPNRISEESPPQPQKPMTSQTQQTDINTTFPSTAVATRFRFVLFPLMLVEGCYGSRHSCDPCPAHSKVVVAAYAIDRIREENKTNLHHGYCSSGSVNTTTVENEARISSTGSINLSTAAIISTALDN